MFHTLKCGTKSQDTEVLNFTSKTLPFNAGNDYGDGDEIHGFEGGYSRNRKRIAYEMIRDRNNRTNHIEEPASTDRTLISRNQSSSPN